MPKLLSKHKRALKEIYEEFIGPDTLDPDFLSKIVSSYLDDKLDDFDKQFELLYQSKKFDLGSRLRLELTILQIKEFNDESKQQTLLAFQQNLKAYHLQAKVKNDVNTTKGQPDLVQSQQLKFEDCDQILLQRKQSQSERPTNLKVQQQEQEKQRDYHKRKNPSQKKVYVQKIHNNAKNICELLCGGKTAKKILVFLTQSKELESKLIYKDKQLKPFEKIPEFGCHIYELEKSEFQAAYFLQTQKPSFFGSTEVKNKKQLKILFPSDITSLFILNPTIQNTNPVIKQLILSIFLKLCEIKKVNRIPQESFFDYLRSLVYIFKLYIPSHSLIQVRLDQFRRQLHDYYKMKYFSMFWFDLFGQKSQEELVFFDLTPRVRPRELVSKFTDQIQKFKNIKIFTQFVSYLQRVQFYSTLRYFSQNQAEDLFINLWNDEQTNLFELCKPICFINPHFLYNMSEKIILQEDESQHTINALQFFMLQILAISTTFTTSHINPDQKSNLVVDKMRLLGKYISRFNFHNYKQDQESNQNHRLLIQNYRQAMDHVFFWNGYIRFQNFTLSKKNSFQLYKLYKKYLSRFPQINQYFDQNLNRFLLSHLSGDKSKLFELITIYATGQRKIQEFTIIQKILADMRFIDESLLIRIIELFNDQQYDHHRIIQVLKRYYEHDSHCFEFAKINIPQLLQRIKPSNNHLKRIQQLLQLLSLEYSDKSKKDKSALYHLKTALKCNNVEIQQRYCSRVIGQIVYDLKNEKRKSDDEIYRELHEKIPGTVDLQPHQQSIYFKGLYSLKQFRYNLASDQIFRIMQEKPHKLTYQKDYFRDNLKNGLKVIQQRLDQKRLYYQQLSNLQKNLPSLRQITAEFFDLQKSLFKIQKELLDFERKSFIINELLSPYKAFAQNLKEVVNFKDKLNSCKINEVMVPSEELAELYEIAIKVDYLIKTEYWQCRINRQQDTSGKSDKSQLVIQEGIQKIGDFLTIYKKSLQYLQDQIQNFVEKDMNFQQFQAKFLKQKDIIKVLQVCLGQQQENNLEIMKDAITKANLQYLDKSLDYIKVLNKFIKTTNYKHKVKQLRLERTIQTILKTPQSYQVKEIVKQVNSLQEQFQTTFNLGKGETDIFTRLDKDPIYNVIRLTMKYIQLYEYFSTQNLGKQITQQILEYLDDIENTSLGIDAIKDYECVIEYFQQIKGNGQLQDLIKCLRKQPHKTKYLSVCFENCYSLRSQFEQIVWKAKNRQLSFKCQIQQIFKGSTFYCRCEPEVKIQIVLDHQSANNKSQLKASITYKDMNLFKEKSLLIIRDMKKVQKENIAAVNDTISLLQEFEKFFTFVEKIYKQLVTLGNYGFNIQLLTYRERIQKGSYANIIGLQERLSRQEQKWITFIKQIYKRSYLLTHYIGPQLNSFIQISQKEDYLPVFQRILKLDKKKFSRISKLEPSYGQNITKFKQTKDYYQKVSYLERAFDTININENQNQAENKIVIIKCNPCDTYSALLTPRYDKDNQKTYELAKSTEVLYCEEDTSCQQIQIFMYRALIYWSKRHYIIACNNLSQEVKLYFSDLLISLHKTRKQDFSRAQLCFVVNVYDKIVGLLTKPRQFNYERKEMFEKESKELSKQMINHISKSIVVESARAGLGKTFRVERQAKKQLIYFPVCGNIKFQNLSKRLKEILELHEEFTLLIQVGHVENKQKLEVFLAQMVLFRSFYYQEYIFLPPQTQIFIEIENIFEPLQAKQNKKVYHIIQMLKNQKKLINIQKFEALQIFFDQNNLQEKFSLIYLDLVRTGKIISQQLSYKYQYQGKQKKFKSPSQQQCRSNIQYFFVEWFTRKKQEPTFLIYKSFMKMLFNAFKAFSDSPHLHKMQFQGLAAHYQVLRLEQVRKQFLYICIQNILEFLEESITTNDFSDNKNRAAQKGFQDKMKEISLLIVPNADYEGYQFVYLDDKNVNFPIKSLLVKSSAELNRKLKRVYDEETIHTIFKETALNQLQDQLIFKLCDIMYHISNNKKFETNFVKNQNISLKELYDKVPKLRFYKITIDNFYKMCLIILRAFSGVPSIIMGESGVGKTALIDFLVNDIFQEKLMVFNVHAGIHQNQIAKWISQIKEQVEINEKKKRVWVFFDQFNTSDQLSYFKEIIIDRKFMGGKLPDQIIFLAACNPYRHQKQRKINSGLAIQEKFGAVKQLAFKVKPPCLSMIQIMWDYQQLKEEEIKQYVESMIEQVQFFDKKRLTKVIVRAHEYFKEKVQISAVSLRDVTRFRELYNWFLIHMPAQQQKKRKSHLALQKRQIQINNYKLARDDRAVILSFCFCYSLRIQDRRHRNDFLNYIEGKLGLDKNYMITVLQNEQIDYINRLKHSNQKIAYNAALMENLFATLICLMNKIPILIIGNPGSSKSISIKMLDSNLKGINSQSQFCKNLPAINLLNFQGSQSSTSEGVQKIYEKAQMKLLQEQKNRYPNNVKSTVYQCILFDQIGLAQKSVHNPLKVLHSKLQTHKKDLGFIGISNYELDAAKMSRFLVLAHSNPDKNEIKDTSVKIYRSYFPDGKYQEKFKKLGEYYFNFIQQWNRSNQNRQNFFGLRDFYSYIKFICLEMKKNNFNIANIQKIILKSIQTNFDGQPNSVELFCKNAQIKEEVEPIEPIKLVIDNLSNVQSRCLMLIIKNEALIPMINDSIVIKGQKREVVCIYGSTFEADKQSQEYNLQITSKIISYVSRGAILVFKDINNSIQTSLYDLFNKSFSHRNNIKTCRIAVGANSNPKCTVHQNFNAIVYVQDQMVKNLDLPFINRLQKHELNIMKMIQRQDYQILEQIKNWMKKFTDRHTDVKLKNHNFIVNSSEQALVTLIFKHREAENIIEQVKKDLLKNKTIDFEISLKEKSLELREEVELLCKDIVPFNLNKTDMIIYTYDQFSNAFEEMQENTNRSYSIRLGELKAEKDLRAELFSGLNNKDYNKIEIFVNYQHEYIHLNYLLFVARQIKSQFQIEKQIVIVIQLHRFTFIKEKTEGLNISYLHNYEQYFVQDISRSSNLQNLLESQTFSEVYHKMNLYQKLEIHHLQALKLIKFKVEESMSNELAIQAFQIAAEMLSRNPYYKKQLEHIIAKNLKSMKVDLKQLQSVNQIVLYSSNIYEALQKYVIGYLQQIVVHFLMNIISQGLLINPDLVAMLLNKKDHLKMIQEFLPQVQNVYEICFDSNAHNFEKNLRKQSKITRLIQNNQAKLPNFLSIYPQSFKDFSLIFKMGSEGNVESMLQEIKFKKYIQKQEKTQLENKLEGIKSKFERIKLKKIKQEDIKIYQRAYFYDCFMYNIELSKLIFEPSEEIQLFEFFSTIFQVMQFKIEQKLIFLLSNRTFTENLLSLLASLFKYTNSSKLAKSIIDDIPEQQPIISILIVVAQKALEKACSLIKLENESLYHFEGNIDLFIKFIRVIYRKMKLFGKNFKEIEQLSIDYEYDSIFKFIQFLNNLKKHKDAVNQQKMLSKFLTENGINDLSLNNRIFRFTQSFLIRESNEVINQQIIDYLSLFVWPEWFEKLEDFPNQHEECVQSFVSLCIKYPLFANNSTIFFNCIFSELDDSDFNAIYEKMREIDQTNQIKIKGQWIDFKNNFSIAFGNYLQSIFSRLIKQSVENPLSLFLNDYSTLFIELCNLKEIRNNCTGVFIYEFLKFYGKNYLFLLEKDQNIDLLVKLDNVLCQNNQQIRHLRVFLLKELYQVDKDFGKIKKEYIDKNQKCKWITLLAEYIEEKKIQVFLPPEMLDRDEDYLRLLQAFERSKFKDIDLYHQIIAVAFHNNNPWNVYELLNFFMLKFYRRQCTEDTIDKLISELDNREDVHRPGVGFFYRLLRGYLKKNVTQNFRYSQSDFKEQILFLNYFNLISSGKNLKILFNNMFFNSQGQIPKDYPEWLLQRYLIGTIHNPAARRVEFILQRHKMNMQGNSYNVCSSTCDYIGPVGGTFYGKNDGCAHPLNNANCPFCGGILGAHAYNILTSKDKGARIINPPDVEKELKRINQKKSVEILYNQKKITLELTGYQHKNSIQHLREYAQMIKQYDGISFDRMKQNGDMLSYKLLQFLSYLTWYFLCQLEIIQNRHIEAIWNKTRRETTQFLYDACNYYLHDIQKCLKIDTHDDFIVWNLGVASKLQQFYNQYQTKNIDFDLRNVQTRNYFQEHFEQVFSVCYEKQKQALINKSRKFQQKDKTDLIKQIGNLQEHEVQFKHIAMFKIIKSNPCYEDMKVKYKNTIIKSYPILAYIIQNEDVARKLQNYKQIFIFLSALQELFDGKLKRSQSDQSLKHTLLFSKESSELLKNLQTFIDSWNSLAQDKFQLKIDCHSEKVLGNLPEITPNSPLRMFLMDRKTTNNQHGERLLAFMQIASREYNDKAQTIQRLIVTSYPYYNDLQVFSTIPLNPTHILNNFSQLIVFPLERLSQLVDLYSSQSVKYGESKPHYSLQNIQRVLVKEFIGCKYLISEKEKFKYITYIGERSHFISELRDREDQKTLEQLGLKQKVLNYFNNLQKNNKNSFEKEVRSIQSSLQQIIAFYMNIRDKDKMTNQTLSEFIAKYEMKGIVPCLKENPLDQILNSCLADFYEFVENYSFEGVELLLDPSYNHDFDEKQKERVKLLIQRLKNSDGKSIPSYNDFKTALYRFTGRILTLAQSNEKNKLSDYLIEQAYWPKSWQSETALRELSKHLDNMTLSKVGSLLKEFPFKSNQQAKIIPKPKQEKINPPPVPQKQKKYHKKIDSNDA